MEKQTFIKWHPVLYDRFYCTKLYILKMFPMPIGCVLTSYSGGSRISHWGVRRPRRGGANSRGGYVSKNLYVKTKESGPWGGVRRRRPLDPPMSYQDQTSLFRFREAPVENPSIIAKFAIVCSVNTRDFPQGTGKTKKDAKTEAARNAFMIMLGIDNDAQEEGTKYAIEFGPIKGDAQLSRAVCSTFLKIHKHATWPIYS